MSKDPNKKLVVLLTGASTGLGLELTKLITQQPDFHLVATARESSLSRFAENHIFENDQLWLRPMDVLNKHDRDNVLKEIRLKLGGVDILINNAGYMLRAVVEHVAEMERFQQMDTNFRAPMALIRRVLPHMRRSRRGHIINISSVSGMMAMPTMSVYSASKFALEGASESLWYEVRPWNIHVSIVQPGFIHSSSYLNVKSSKECQHSLNDPQDPYYYHYNSMIPFINKVMELTPSTPEQVARTILRLMRKKRPPLRVAATWDAHFFFILRRFLPRSFYHWFLYRSLPHIRQWGSRN
ncbi:MAG: SDR family NAD(P)-dependent oxidoreductase [Bdellovibrionales bacterium]|nr:SDR family NAD(P)-dependent oxidoreductase [Bdellovibrionales bacterium]